jgi:hypothetical protein
MNHTDGDRRKAENEVIFRRHNESVEKGFEEIKQFAKEDGQEGLIPEKDGIALRFYCECSDENCQQRILLKPSEYNKLHRRRNHFVIVHDHEVVSIEKVVAREKDYSVVEKSFVPSIANVGLNALNSTDANNA